MSDTAAIALAVFLLAANAFFVGAEFALISARRATIEPRAEGGSRAAKVTLAAMENVSLMMAGAQLGITICSLGLGAIGEPAVAHLIEKPMDALGVPEAFLHPIAFAIALSVVVFLHVVIGEMVPKNLALAAPDRWALVLAPLLTFVVRVLRPALWVLNGIANLSLRAVRVQPKDEVTSAFSRDEVAGLVDESRREGLLDDEEHDLLSGALDFDRRDVGRVLLPLERIATIPRGATAAEVEQIAGRTGFSRFPVVDDGGEYVGYLHLKDALELDEAKRSRPLHAKWVRPLPHVRRDDSLRAALATMQRSGAHLARVVGSDGTLSGVVALEDVLEELVGEIRDETRQETRAGSGGAVRAGR